MNPIGCVPFPFGPVGRGNREACDLQPQFRVGLFMFDQILSELIGLTDQCVPR